MDSHTTDPTIKEESRAEEQNRSKPGPNKGDQSPIKPKRSLAVDALLGLAVCLFFFLGAELVLRVAGWPGKDVSQDPYVGFAALKPLFVEENGTVKTAPYKDEYFNDVSFPAKKVPNTMRVFCFGGSTTHGRPYDFSSSFTRWLEDLLSASIPKKRFEVINAGGISYASYRIVPLVEEAMKYEPDLVVVYSGHNEFLERRTYSGLFSQGKFLLTVRSFAEDMAVYRALREVLLSVLPIQDNRAALRGAIKGSGPEKLAPPESSGSQKTVLAEEVSATLDWSGGLELYHRDEKFADGVVKHFKHNLQKMVDICKGQGVPIILIEPAVNLKDFSPFKSEPVDRLTQSQLGAVEDKVEELSRLVGEGQDEKALELAQAIDKEAPQYAATSYWKAKALLHMGRKEEARVAFVQAKDQDVCPLRSITRIQRGVSEIAAENDVPFIPFKEIMWQRASTNGDKSGIPGNESFLDHVHPSIEVHQLLAKLIMAKMVAMKMVKPTVQLSDAQIDAMFVKSVASLDERFMAMGELNLAKVLSWAGKIDEGRIPLQKAAKVLDDDPEVHEMLGNSYLDYEDYANAIKEFKRAVELADGAADMLFPLANAYVEAGDEERAIEIYREIIATDEVGPEAYANLSQLYLKLGRTAEAEKLVRSGLKKFSDPGVLLGEYGVVLAVSRKYKEAVPWLKMALAKLPGDPNILYDLAAVHSALRNYDEALTCLELAAKGKGVEPELLMHAKQFEAVRDTPRFKKVLMQLK